MLLKKEETVKIDKIPLEMKNAKVNLLNILHKKVERMSFLEKPDTFERKVLDIYSKNPYPSGTLSNFRRCSFELDGVKCSSIEGVLQSLKVIIPAKSEKPTLWAERMHLQEKVCALANSKAKRTGNFLNFFNPDLQINWRGKIIDRMSKEYQRFLKRVFEARYLADPDYRNAIMDTKDYCLTHKIGKQNKAETCLTEKEFIGMILHLRKKFKVK